MKLRHVLTGVAAVLASSSVFAGVVTGSSNIDFLAVDGQKVGKDFLKDSGSFNATPGDTHQVVVRVSEIVRSGSDRSLYESDPIIITFQGAQDDIRISVPRLDTQRDVDAFSKNPQISVKTVSGKNIENTQDTLKQEGFLPGLNLEENLSQYNNSGAKAAVARFASTSMPAAMPAFGKTQKGKIVVQGENVAEQQLQYWFQQADKETQARFLNWAKKQ